MKKSPQLDALFAERRQPQHAASRDVHQQLAPILRVVTQVQKQMAANRELLLAAELNASDPNEVRWQLERLHQTAGALDTDLKLLIEIGRRVVQSMAQWDRYSDEIEVNMRTSEEQ